MGLRCVKVKSRIAGLGNTANSINKEARVELRSRHTSFRAEVTCLVIDHITMNILNIPLRREGISVPSNMPIADPQFDKCRRVDMLIGASLFWQLLCIGQHRAAKALLWQKTQLGWVLGGCLTWPIKGGIGISRCHIATEDIEQLFKETTRRDRTGRYIVRIPFRDNINEIGASRERAEQRIRALERRFRKLPELRRSYIEFMEEYERLGHMTRIEVSVHDGGSFYLPHHAVTKTSSTTTKVRVVFDGSAKSSSGFSLNDAQFIGSIIQDDLFSILVCFRTHNYVLSVDIEKMYRQILVDPEDRAFQRILWRPDVQSRVHEYELNTVTYGTASAPFLATRVLQQVGLECAQTHPETSQIILRDFYVDDLLSGTETLAAARQRKRELSAILAKAGFQLRKWASNCPSIVAEESLGKVIAERDPRTLGLL